jgi:predicted transcriptional regulator
MAKRTFTPQMRAVARELFDEGLGCNAIARKIEISPAAVSKWAKDEGIKFDRSQAALAVRAHTVDLAQARLELAAKMMVVATDSLDMLDGPFTVFAFGGKENDFNSQELDSAPMEARRSAQMIAGVAFDKATKVVEATPEGVIGAESLIDRIEAGLSRFDDDKDDPIVE